MGASLEVVDLSHRYAAFLALNGVSFALRQEVTALVGVNGAGKTTLLTAISGGRRPMAGTVTIHGLDPYRSSQRRAALAHVSLMPQSVRFPGNMTALEVVEYLAWMRGVPRKHINRNARDSLARVLLTEHADTKIRRLSGGMLRRVALAQAIASKPAVLLLDEPSTGLDPRQRRTMVELLGELEMTVLLSSHVMEDVTDVAQRVLVLDDGVLAFDGTVTQLCSLAPEGTPSGKAAEAGFLRVLTDERSGVI